MAEAPGGDYAEDLAYVHDRGFDTLARSAAVRLLSELHRRGLRGGLITELGFGGGVSSAILSEAGYEVAGSDPSPAQIAIARRRAGAARFEVADLERAELSPSVAITAFGEVLNYYADQPRGRAGLARVLERLAEALVDGGILLFDLAAPGRVSGANKSGFAEGDDWALLHTATESRDGSMERRITVFRSVAGSWRRSQELHRLELFSSEVVLELLAATGLQATPLGGYEGASLGPGLVSYLGVRSS